MLTLYHHPGCPFCRKVYAALEDLGMTIAMKNIRASNTARAELVAGGGKAQVPCLRIENDEERHPRWMYESDDIIAFLRGGAA